MLDNLTPRHINSEGSMLLFEWLGTGLGTMCMRALMYTYRKRQARKNLTKLLENHQDLVKE